jgi:hypothetical protein
MVIFHMKDYFIRLIFGVLTISIMLGAANIFNIDWLQEVNPGRNLFILPIGLVGGWGGWYIYKAMKRRSSS